MHIAPQKSRSQTIYGGLVETYGPYLQDYTSYLSFIKLDSILTDSETLGNP